MPLVATDAIVLHVANYLETSRLIRLATRDAGLVSVIARGARTSKKRFGSAVDLFAEGQAQIDLRPGRDLHTLTSFDVTRSHPALAADLSRFSAAAALAECAQRILHDEPAPGAFEELQQALRDLAVSEGPAVPSAGLGALWRLLAASGFAPVLSACVDCHTPLTPADDLTFSSQAGGLRCFRCAARVPGGRRLPASAQRVLQHWLDGEAPPLEPAAARAHQRLFREFLSQHVTDGRPLRAFLQWETGQIDRTEPPVP